MPVNSQFLQISKYALVEYIYSDEIITTTQARCLRLQNKYTNTYQFLNGAQAYKRTGNILDRSASRLGTTVQSWAYHDIDAPIPIIQKDANFVLEDLTASLVANQNYDTIRVHFLAGYTFPGLEGLITEVQFNEWTASGLNSRPFTAAAYVYLKSEPLVTFATDPIFIGDRYFDRYIEFKIPSLYSVNLDFWSSPGAPNTFGYNYTFNNVGFLKTSQISVNVYEVNSISEVNGNKFLNTGTSYNGSYNQQDEYSYLGAVIKENAENDYIEYYPSYHGGFIEDYINLLNETGSWVVINQLLVTEQVANSFFKTADVTMLQEDNFDQPGVYRPIIRNASAAFSYTIEYIVRLLNKVNNQEIVRRSTFTSTDAKKYGLQLEKINALEGFRPIKVYNKIVKADEIPGPALSFGAPRFITQNNYINNYYDVNYISVDSTSDISAEVGQIVYPQGKNLFYMNPFDNYVKFKLFTKSKDRKQNVTMDLASTGMNVRLSFIFDDKSQIFIDPTQDIQAANPGAGEILFKIESETAIKLIGGTTRNYYLVNSSLEGDDVLIYTGKFEDTALRDISQISIRNNEDITSLLDGQIQSLQTLVQSTQALPTTNGVSIVTSTSNGATETTTTTTGVGPTGTTLVSLVTSSPQQTSLDRSNALLTLESEKSRVFVSEQSQGVISAINEAANKLNGAAFLNIPDVPGVTPSLSTLNWNTIAPVVVNPSSQEIPVTSIIRNPSNTSQQEAL
jgi:hypothetical protein